MVNAVEWVVRTSASVVRGGARLIGDLAEGARGVAGTGRDPVDSAYVHDPGRLDDDTMAEIRKDAAAAVMRQEELTAEADLDQTDPPAG